MEDEKKVVNLDEDQLEQVAGGLGDAPYTECFFYKELLRTKDNESVNLFRKALEKTWNNDCRHWKENIACYDCPVCKTWRFEYLR